MALLLFGEASDLGDQRRSGPVADIAQALKLGGYGRESSRSFGAQEEAAGADDGDSATACHSAAPAIINEQEATCNLFGELDRFCLSWIKHLPQLRCIG